MCAAQRGLLACLVRGGLPCPTLARRSCGGDSAEPSRGLVMAPTPAPGSKRRVQAARTPDSGSAARPAVGRSGAGRLHVGTARRARHPDVGAPAP